MAERLQAMGQQNHQNGFELTLQPRMLELPLRWKEPPAVFVNSMSDVFHEDVPLDCVESDRYRSRVDDLRETPATTKFLSLEPLLGPVPNIDLRGIDGVIVGGESRHKARPMDPGWARDIRDQCQRRGVPFFFKQWGGKDKKAAGCVLDGRAWDEMPNSFGDRRRSRPG